MSSPPPITPPAVFLSYAREDSEPARRIADALRASGVEVWFDQSELVGGDAWDAKIRKQIKECALFAPIISGNTQVHPEGDFRIEWELAAERAKAIQSGWFILPVIMGDTRELDALVPDCFREVQWLRLGDGEMAANVQQRFLRAWSQRVGGHSPSPTSREPRAFGQNRTANGITPVGGRRLAAIVFTDVVGYSARMQTDEAGTLALVQSDSEQMRRQCAQHGGQTLKSTGDGLLLCFDSVVDAVTCAVAIQATFAGRGVGALQHRLGVHLGDVYHQAGDVVGDGVNLAARLQTAAQPGTICVSDAVFAAVKGKVAMESVALAPLVLKNIAQPLPAYLIAPVGTRLTPGVGARGARRRRGWLVAAVGVVLLAVGAGFFFHRAPSVASTISSNPPTATAAEFPRDPDLKRVYRMIYNVVDGIAEDFALMDDLVKPLLATRPNDPEVVTVAAELAQEFITRGFDASPSRRAQAQRLTERAVQLAPENPEALAALGNYLWTTRTQLGRAEELLRRAIKLKPTEPRFQCFLYRVLTANKKPAAEIEAFGAQLVASFPNYPMADCVIAYHYIALAELTIAEEWIDKALALAPVPDAITLKAQMMLEVHGDIAGMERWLERMPERQRTSAALVNAYAVLATVTGQTRSARRVVNATADTWLQDGSYIFPKALLAGELEQIDGHADVARRQFEGALNEIKARLAAEPTDLRPVRAELWAQLGLGHRTEARAALQTNLEKRPRPYVWSMNLSWWTSALRACLLLDERTQAIALLQEASVKPQSRLLLRNLFRVDPKMAPFRADPEIMALLKEPEPAVKP